MEERLDGLGREEFDIELALKEAEDEASKALSPTSSKISDEVLIDLVHRALSGNDKVKLAVSGVSPVLGLGRKGSEGLTVTIDSKSKTPQVTLDAYVLIRYGMRIPDLAWDIQESLKKELERVTGYEIKAVNIHVQGIFFPDKEPATDSERSIR